LYPTELGPPSMEKYKITGHHPTRGMQTRFPRTPIERERPSQPFLGGHSKQLSDPSDLPYHISFVRAWQLPFSHDVQDLIAL
jgi:hypothetical protein